mmetsp:Transcript_22260/g.58172  ORF Transcript_22260/g.58172 Transcript_22260/m.58172 type:complete len:218 (+) Transcript_22260:755-1408(+)
MRCAAEARVQSNGRHRRARDHGRRSRRGRDWLTQRLRFARTPRPRWRCRQGRRRRTHNETEKAPGVAPRAHGRDLIVVRAARREHEGDGERQRGAERRGRGGDQGGFSRRGRRVRFIGVGRNRGGRGGDARAEAISSSACGKPADQPRDGERRGERRRFGSFERRGREHGAGHRHGAQRNAAARDAHRGSDGDAHVVRDANKAEPVERRAARRQRGQ